MKKDRHVLYRRREMSNRAYHYAHYQSASVDEREQWTLIEKLLIDKEDGGIFRVEQILRSMNNIRADEFFCDLFGQEMKKEKTDPCGRNMPLDWVTNFDVKSFDLYRDAARETNAYFGEEILIIDVGLNDDGEPLNHHTLSLHYIGTESLKPEAMHHFWQTKDAVVKI